MCKRQTVEAVFEKGVFRPLTHPEVSDGETVHLIVEPDMKGTGQDPLALAMSVYDGLASDEVLEIERIALDRSRFFDHRAPERS